MKKTLLLLIALMLSLSLVACGNKEEVDDVVVDEPNDVQETVITEEPTVEPQDEIVEDIDEVSESGEEDIEEDVEAEEVEEDIEAEEDEEVAE